ncbi:MAG: transcription antitermination protein NusB, partial [Alphaproteobacteria bacterium]|nr:transcription antitermination protein NusB [Alphaproteobacteria bacterium]
MSAPGEAHAPKDARHASRLAAVQAIYQMELTGADAETVAEEFIEHRFGPDGELGEPDTHLFGAIVRGVPHHQSEIDRAVTGCLAEGWRLARVDSILRAILRAAAYELISRTD